MIETAELFGHVDGFGKRIGFLVPVFRSRGSNALLVQRVSADRRVVAFVPIEPNSVPIAAVSKESIVVGEEPIWSFVFGGGDIVEARESAFRSLLGERLDDPALADHPLLTVEIAEFLGLPEQRLAAAVKAFSNLGKLGGSAARSWRDLSILTPDVRRAAATAGGDVASIANRLVVQTDGDFVSIRSPILLTDETAGIVTKLTGAALQRLEALYPPPRKGWTFRMRYPDAGPRTSAPEAVVLIPDRREWDAAHLLEQDYRWRIDAYPMTELSAFHAAMSEPGIDGFTLVRGDGERAAREAFEMGGPDAVPIIVGANGRFPLHEKPDLFGTPEPPAHILVPATGFPGSPRSAQNMSATVRQVIAAALGARERYGPKAMEGRWAFYRTRGLGPFPECDAAATLYDRLLAKNLSGRQLFLMRGKQSRPRVRDPQEIPREMLLPGSVLLYDRRTIAAMEGSRSDAALLPVRPRGEADWADHRRAVEMTLHFRGWRAHMPRGGEDGLFEVDIPLRLRYLRLRPDLVLGTSWNRHELLSRDLRDVDTVVLTGEANPTAILTRLEQRGELAISMRDLCASNGEAGIWSIFAAQLRRLASGQLHRARSDFAALLVHQAFKLGHAGFEDDGALYDALHGAEFGESVHLSWGRVRETSEHVKVQMKLVAGYANQYLQSGASLIQPFDLVLHPSGVALERLT